MKTYQNSEYNQGAFRRAFSYIELIGVLIIVSITSVIAGAGIVKVTEAYIVGRNNVESSQEAQMVINRLIKEFIYPANTPVISNAGKTLTFPRGTGVAVVWDGVVGGDMTLNGFVLCRGIQSFNATLQANGSVRISLTLTKTANIDYTFDMYPRS